MVHCIYTMVIRPVLTYGSTAWWQRVTYNVRRREPSKLQRLVCITITEEMRMAPAAAMTVLLGLPPLHEMTEVETQAGIYRLMCSQQWKPQSTNFGHAWQSRNMEHEPILQMGTDRIIPRYVYKAVTVKFCDKYDQQNRKKQNIKGGLDWRTDRWKTNERH